LDVELRKPNWQAAIQVGNDSDSRGIGRRDTAAAHKGQDLALDLLDGVVAPVEDTQMLEEIGQTAKRDVAFNTPSNAIHDRRAYRQFRSF
jgi:hypothetical protein